MESELPIDSCNMYQISDFELWEYHARATSSQFDTKSKNMANLFYNRVTSTELSVIIPPEESHILSW